MLTVLGGNNPASTGYNLTRSLRFRSSASARLVRTFGTPTNQNKWTFSVWVKTSTIVSNTPTIIGADTSASTALDFTTNSTLEFGWSGGQLITTQVFRDPSAWYHIIVAADTTNATASNRLKIYVNGAEVTAFSTDNRSALGSGSLKINSAVLTNIGTNPAAARYYDGYLAEINFVDGQALTPSSFGSTNTLTGVWQPARYGGTYGTNGFYLPFTDNSALTTSSNVGLGKDFSGNGNYWTTNNISITAGTTYDSMTDVPTLTSATAANFAVLNPVAIFVGGNTASISNGNLKTATTGNPSHTAASMTIPASGKFYFEVTATSIDSVRTYIGMISTQSNALSSGSNASYNWTYTMLYSSNGDKYINTTSSTGSAYGSSYTNGDVISVAYDNGKLWFAKNGTWQASGDPVAGTNPAATGMNVYGDWFPYMGFNSTFDANFGQRPFSYTPPTGYVALNTYNLPTSTIVKGNTVMDATLWTGNSTGSTTQTITNAGGFKPDFLWGKSRSAAYNHVLIDSVRGVTKLVYSDLTNAEVTNANALSSFNSNGFTVGTDAGGLNDNGKTFVGWQWQAGQGTTSTNTSGSITSTVSVNASAGFSIVTYTGTGSVATVGHGLGVAPNLIIVKRRDAVASWDVYHSSIGATGRLYLNTTDATNTSSAPWNNTAPTSSVFTVGTATDTNASGSAIVAYCFAPIAGYSAFGSYTGNGSATGPFVYTGFQPRYLMVKRSDSTANWFIWDTARNPYNIAPAGVLFADSSAVEYATSNGYSFGITSNGFYLPVSTAGINGSGGTFIYAAFATSPFKNSLAF